MKTAFVTLLCGGDGYVPGVEALGQSIKATGTSSPRVVMATSDVSRAAREKLEAQGWALRDVEPIANPRPPADLLMPRFQNVYTKLRAWQLVEFDKVVFLDADTIVLKPIDELFERPSIAAAPDFFLPDRFSSGVMVLDPSEDTLARMLEALPEAHTYDGGDQGFLNSFFSDWYSLPVEHRLPIGYNLAHFIYQFVLHHPAVSDVVLPEFKVLHYLLQKPWLTHPTLVGGSAVWWTMYYAAHPEKDAGWKRQLHAMEDWSFEKVLSALGA
jgi:alpha-N-acetylglucosamine transferase